MKSTRGDIDQCQNKLQLKFGPLIKSLDETHFSSSWYKKMNEPRDQREREKLSLPTQESTMEL